MNQTPLTDEQKQDVERRKELFTEEFQELSEKYQFTFGSIPMYVPSQNAGAYITTVMMEAMDTKYLSIPSPLGKII